MPFVNNSYKILTAHFGPELAGDIANSVSNLVRGLTIDKVEFEHQDDGPQELYRKRNGALIVKVHSTGLIWPEWRSVKFWFTIAAPMARMFLLDRGEIKLENCIEGLIYAFTGFMSNIEEHNPVFEFVQEEAAQEVESLN